jgi:hypothetical protein
MATRRSTHAGARGCALAACGVGALALALAGCSAAAAGHGTSSCPTNGVVRVQANRTDAAGDPGLTIQPSLSIAVGDSVGGLNQVAQSAATCTIRVPYTAFTGRALAALHITMSTGSATAGSLQVVVTGLAWIGEIVVPYDGTSALVPVTATVTEYRYVDQPVVRVGPAEGTVHLMLSVER